VGWLRTRIAHLPTSERRAYVPKVDGRQLPLGAPTLKDNLVQRGVVEGLNATYEPDSLDFSYGFRSQRSAVASVASHTRAMDDLPSPSDGVPLEPDVTANTGPDGRIYDILLGSGADMSFGSS
jgi:hypothetical protein